MRESTGLIPSAIDASTGQPVAPPDLKEILRVRLEKPKRRLREVVDGVDPEKLEQAGWGIIVAKSDELVYDSLEALQPLDLRKREAGVARYKEFLGADGYVAGEDKLDFLARHGAGPGRVDPTKVPYYLLLVGSPEHIPYEFQYGLDLHHAVGRVYFKTKKEYAAYAQGVVNAEEGTETYSPRKVAFFGPCQDPGTQVSNEALLKPLIESVRTKDDCQVQEVLGENATRAALGRLLGGEETPNLLFSAGHGLQYRSGHELQETYQGALICQDWPGDDAPYPEHTFSGNDLSEHARLFGLISFLFACHSAGTPKCDDFSCKPGEPRKDMAPFSFVSHLAQRLLGHPGGGALAVIGHVHQVWQHSFFWRQTGSQPLPFLETVDRLLKGGPLGWAMEPLNQRFADLSVALGELLKEYFLDGTLDLDALGELWLASQDARNYVILGDPAVRLPGRKSATRG
jgi:hypothetical protein